MTHDPRTEGRRGAFRDPGEFDYAIACALLDIRDELRGVRAALEARVPSQQKEHTVPCEACGGSGIYWMTSTARCSCGRCGGSGRQPASITA